MITLHHANARTYKFHTRARLVYADPPTNRGKNEAVASDRLNDVQYQKFVLDWIGNATLSMAPNAWFIICLYHKLRTVYERIIAKSFDLKYRAEVIWNYGFGLYTTQCVVPCHDNILIYSTGKPSYYWLNVAVESQRLRANDSRANPLGRNIGSVWNIPRVPGNSLSRRFIRGTDRTCQPYALCKRIVLAFTDEDDMVHDMFLGSGTMAKVCQTYQRNYVGLDFSGSYVKEAKERLKNVE